MKTFKLKEIIVELIGEENTIELIEFTEKLKENGLEIEQIVTKERKCFSKNGTLYLVQYI